jgi:SOS-response transcriptional repressor LexA
MEDSIQSQLTKRAGIASDSVRSMSPDDELSKFIRDLREKTGLNLRDFGAKIEYAHSSISNIATGKDKMTVPLLEKLIEEFPKEIRELGKTPDQLRKLVYAARMGTKLPADPTREDGYLPLVGRAQCGAWMAAIANDRKPTGESRMEKVGAEAARKKDAFLVEAVGDSMTGKSPRGGVIREGDLLLVEPHAPINTGDVVLALMDDEATVKIFVDGIENVILKPTNRKHGQIKLSREEFEARGGVLYRITSVQKFAPL